MRVLVADDDQSFCDFVLQTLEGTEFEAEDVTDDPARLVSANTIVVVGGSWCELRLSAQIVGDQVVIGAADDGDLVALDRMLMLGADDVVSKPIAPRSLLARLMVARHRLVTAPRHRRASRTTLVEALDTRQTGTVAVRGNEYSGAIHVHDGGISWVESAGRDVSLPRLLSRFGIELDDDTANAVLAESRQTGDHFTQVLSDWGVVERNLARECVRCYVADEVALLLSDPRATALFLPYDPRRASSLVFPGGEILPATPSESGVVPSSSGAGARPLQTVPGHAMMALHGAGELPGCRGAMLVDRAGGRLAWVGEPLDTHFAWSLVHAMKTTEHALTIEENGMAHMARAIDHKRVIVASFSLRDVNLGLARTSFNACCTRALEGLPGLARNAS